jgi:hypothetical protein
MSDSMGWVDMFRGGEIIVWYGAKYSAGIVNVLAV